MIKLLKNLNKSNTLQAIQSYNYISFHQNYKFYAVQSKYFTILTLQFRFYPCILPRYVDGKSRHVARQFLRLMLEKNADVAVPSLAQSLLDVFGGNWRSATPTDANAKTALAALHWTKIIFQAAK